MPEPVEPDEVITGDTRIEDDPTNPSWPRRVRRWLSRHKHAIWASIIGIIVLAFLAYYAWYAWAALVTLWTYNRVAFVTLTVMNILFGIALFIVHLVQPQPQSRYRGSFIPA